MSSTINFVGLGGAEKKPSSRVLRQPGGGSSITFGNEQEQTPRAVKNNMQSNIFSTEKNGGDQPRRMQKNADSHTRLFGEVNSQPQTPAKNYMKSSILPEALPSTTNDNGHHRDHLRDRNGSVSSASSSVSSSSENLKINGISKTGDNSVTTNNKDDSSVKNGTNHVINRNRVPPGGFSSGLW